jgi:hypothetical protein
LPAGIAIYTNEHDWRDRHRHSDGVDGETRIDDWRCCLKTNAGKIRLKIDNGFGCWGQLLFAVGIRATYLADFGIQPSSLMHHKISALDAAATLPGGKNHQLFVGMGVALKTPTDGQSMNLHIGIGGSFFGNRDRIALDLPAHTTTDQKFSAKFDGSIDGKSIVDN